MATLRNLTVALLAAVLWFSASSAYAQQAIAPFRPAQPELSPYLYLTRPDSGIFPNYQAFVQPLQNQQMTNQMQQSEIQRLQQAARQQKASQYAPATVNPTGTASTFRNTSHFYPGMTNTAPARRNR